MVEKKEDKLKRDYESKQVSAERFRSELVEQIKELTYQNNIYLAVPIESRVKAWSSISSKIEGSNLKLKDILQLNDLVGIRLILLFKRDLDRCRKLIEENLEIIEQEDTASRLDESQFGYQSFHYVIKLPKEWLSIPTLKDFSEYKAEIQIRTIAQHIWAAASHYLQYKQEDNAPKTLRRSLYRVSAFLETVDLEFDRLLIDRESYVQKLKPETQDETLNVDILKDIMDSHLPIANRSDPEDYSNLLKNLSNCGIEKSSQLISLIKEKLEAAMEEEKKLVKRKKEYFKETGDIEVEDDERAIKQGVFFAHAGLVRQMLERKFGNNWRKMRQARFF